MMNFKVFLKNKLRLDPRLMRQLRKIFAPFRRIGVNKKFTIFSDNCWGGRLYDKFGLQYLSPTIGLAFEPHDFIEFVKSYDLYFKKDLQPNLASQRKVNDEWGFYDCRLDDILIQFRHYRNVEDAIDKWNRRKNRIVDNIILKMSYYEENDVDYELINNFSSLPYKKILFTNKKELKDNLKIDYVVIINIEDKDDEFVLSDKQLNLKQIKKIINK